MKKQNSKLAFSLIELSVVILIIGILVIGITKGSRIIRASKLRSAQTLTTSSPVSSMDGLLVWYESTLDKSFNASEAIDTPLANQGTISTWYDINPQTTTRNNAIQNNNPDKPRYILSAMNGLPAVNLDGSTDYLSYDGSRLANSNYTIFVVEQRRDGGSYRLFLAGANGGNNIDLHLGYESNTTVYFAHYNNDYRATIEGFSSPIPRIHAFRFSSTLGRNYNINGSPVNSFTCISTCSATTPLSAYDGAMIGRNYMAGSNYYYGDIGEIIEFNRYLTDTERSNVEKYLKAKWGIK